MHVKTPLKTSLKLFSAFMFFCFLTLNIKVQITESSQGEFQIEPIAQSVKAGGSYFTKPKYDLCFDPFVPTYYVSNTCRFSIIPIGCSAVECRGTTNPPPPEL